MKKLLLTLFIFTLVGPALFAADAAASLTGVRADILQDMKETQDHLVQLAEAFPADKYGWKPGEGVRSAGEVFLHVANGNYHIPAYFGVKAPADLPKDMEKSATDKAKIVQTLKNSIEFVNQAIMKTPDSDLDRKIKVFGMDMTVRGAMILLAGHMHEHLGQAIAYARTNGVVPPWSAKENAPAAQSQSSY